MSGNVKYGGGHWTCSTCGKTIFGTSIYHDCNTKLNIDDNMPYAHIKNKENQLKAKENSLKYGFFTFDRSFPDSKLSIFSVKRNKNKFDVMYMTESEIDTEPNTNCVVGHYVTITNDGLISLDDGGIITSGNNEEYIKAIYGNI